MPSSAAWLHPVTTCKVSVLKPDPPLEAIPCFALEWVGDWRVRQSPYPYHGCAFAQPPRLAIAFFVKVY